MFHIRDILTFIPTEVEEKQLEALLTWAKAWHYPQVVVSEHLVIRAGLNQWAWTLGHITQEEFDVVIAHLHKFDDHKEA